MRRWHEPWATTFCRKARWWTHSVCDFDFSHGEPVSAEVLADITAVVNEQVRANEAVSTELMTMDAAIEAGAMALFGEKYGEEVRVLTMGADRFSVELCGGTHVSRTGDIGLFDATAESGVASGVA